MANVKEDLIKLINDFIQLKLGHGEVETKQYFLIKYLTPLIEELSNKSSKLDEIYEKLETHNKEQAKAIKESSDFYHMEMKKRDENATLFIKGKTDEELKEYLADQYIPCDKWNILVVKN